MPCSTAGWVSSSGPWDPSPGSWSPTAPSRPWKPRRGAVPAALLAAAGSIFFVILDFRRQNPQAALIDAVYPLAALILLVKSRHRA